MKRAVPALDKEGGVRALLAIPVAEIIRVIVTDVLAYRRSRVGEEEEEEPTALSPSFQPPPT